MTIRLCQSLQSIGLATSGKGGAKLAARLGMQTSRYTILRRIMDLPDPPTGSVVYVGIDDLRVSKGLPVRNHPRELGEPPCCRLVSRPSGRNRSKVDASTTRPDGGQP